ncbi:hypothetical protein P7H38_10070 [Lactococcus raffinolactis]|uniref:hypothetical protein n=1 Tax=Pseudolactococcus raffinolactis TaxID=1366 RepID=UPI00289080C0|nr:hypothetical protein [Lactococcus raffinolactis]MDT2767020.1 hypothetical protein [Lactococcus raffinolactis]MDT2790145.1 hypothetical protein [Lactococcus raffinolactis]
MVKAKKKYGLDTFNKGYSVDVKETYGDLIYLDTIASERFNYEDTETGAIYDSQAELDKEQPDKNLQKVENTHKIEQLYVQVYSEVQKDNMDIRVPLDFDDTKFKMNDRVRLTGKVIARLQTGTKRVEVTTANGRTRQEVVPDYYFTVSSEGLEKVSDHSTAPAPQPPKPKEESQKK